MTPEEKELLLAALALHESHVFGCGSAQMQAYEKFDEVAAAFWRKKLAEGVTSPAQVLKKYEPEK
jgi:hypothetical protein